MVPMPPDNPLNTQAIERGLSEIVGAIRDNGQSVIVANIQKDTTNLIDGEVRIMSGWGQMLGTGATSMSEVVTFPEPVALVHAIVISGIGYKSGGTPATDISQFNTPINVASAEAYLITTTGFTARFGSPSAMGAAYHGYSWIAVYTPA